MKLNANKILFGLKTNFWPNENKCFYSIYYIRVVLAQIVFPNQLENITLKIVDFFDMLCCIKHTSPCIDVTMLILFLFIYVSFHLC